MDRRTRMLAKVPTILVLAAVASCGSPANWVGDGGSLDFGNGSNGAGVGSLLPIDGGTSGGSTDLTATGQVCSALGATRTCCTSGMQACASAGEFAVWGACLSAAGATVTCGSVGGGCVTSETGRVCDGGSSSGGGGSGGSSGGPTPPPPSICADTALNTEQEILAAYSPPIGQTVGPQGQIRVWVNDERPPFIAPNEQVDPNTGAVVVAGDRSATAPDGLLWEPALYLAPQTPQNGGMPHFPQWIKGWYNNAPPNFGPALGSQTAGMDPPPPGSKLASKYTAEYAWDVSTLGLSAGIYTAIFVIHDGDRDRGIGCVTVAIGP
jgi:hypothetical protein